MGSLLHIWWTCPKLQPFWKEVHRITNQVTTFNLNFSPEQILLHHSSIPKSAYLRLLAIHMVNAAKMYVPAKRRSPESLSITDWFKRIQKTAEMEDLIHQTKVTTFKFTKRWSCWLNFVTTDEYKNATP